MSARQGVMEGVQVYSPGAVRLLNTVVPGSPPDNTFFGPGFRNAGYISGLPFSFGSRKAALVKGYYGWHVTELLLQQIQGAGGRVAQILYYVGVDHGSLNLCMAEVFGENHG